MKLTDLIVSPKSLGDKLWLVDVSPAYEYKDGKRTDTVLGYRYSVALPEKGLDKVDVRIDGQQQTEAPNGYVEVRFDGLEVFIYDDLFDQLAEQRLVEEAQRVRPTA